MYYLRKRIGRAAKRALGMKSFPPGRYRHLYDEIVRLGAEVHVACALTKR